MRGKVGIWEKRRCSATSSASLRWFIPSRGKKVRMGKPYARRRGAPSPSEGDSSPLCGFVSNCHLRMEREGRGKVIIYLGEIGLNSTEQSDPSHTCENKVRKKCKRVMMGCEVMDSVVEEKKLSSGVQACWAKWSSEKEGEGEKVVKVPLAREKKEEDITRVRICWLVPGYLLDYTIWIWRLKLVQFHSRARYSKYRELILLNIL